MDYSVYRASYKTVKGTWRDYLGYTPALDLRLWWHKNKPPAWMRCRGSEITLTVVENGLATKAEALACEALHAARAVTRSPLVARGGPWVRPTLPEGALEEAAAVAKCSSFGALFAQAKATPGSLLSKHLRGLDFTPAAKCFCGERVYRGGHVERLKKQKSGTNGYRSRKSQLERGVLKKPSARLERLRRGTNPKKRRAEEQKKRGPRPRSER